MGSVVRKVVKVDHTMLPTIRCKFARMCVEIDHRHQPLVPLVFVMGYEQVVEYEGLHLICFSCGEYGYRGAGCPKNAPEVVPYLVAQ